MEEKIKKRIKELQVENLTRQQRLSQYVEETNLKTVREKTIIQQQIGASEELKNLLIKEKPSEKPVQEKA